MSSTAVAADVLAAQVTPPAWQRALLVVGLAWALVVVVPDFYRVAAPLATLGFYADNSGMIYQAPEGAELGGVIRPELNMGDHVVLSPGACWQPTSRRCRDYLGVFGGMGGLSYVLPETLVTLRIQPADGSRATDVTIAAQPKPLEPSARIFLGLCEVAAVIVLWLAFRLAWDAPSRMTVGFFLFAMWFNPGQYFALYAWLQQHPLLLLAQESLQAIAQGAGYAGFLIFALRFPHNRRAHRLRRMERAAVVLGVTLALLQLASFLNVFGVPTEIVTRFAILGGYAVASLAFVVVWLRLRYQSPLDYQRMRWVLWGCAIGIPTFVFADSNEATSLWARYIWSLPLFGGWQPEEWVFELAFLISGLLAIFICAAVRHRRIVNVNTELRATAASLVMLVVGVLIEVWVHDPVKVLLDAMHVPTGLNYYLAIVPLVACSAAVHRGAHTVDHLFNRGFFAATKALDEAAKTVAQAEEPLVDELLVQAPIDALDLASAAVLRAVNGVFSTVRASPEWDTKLLDLASPAKQGLVQQLRKGEMGLLSVPAQDVSDPDDAATPALALPVVLFGEQLYAVAAYGAHRNGAALDKLELDLLTKFVAQAVVSYERAEVRRLRAAGARDAVTSPPPRQP